MILIVSQIIGLFSAPFWLCYNYISQPYGAALGSVIAIVSVVVSLVRYRKKREDI